ncbi:MAG TPA: hypothetical protein VG817_09085 [Gemmatimonadales bacterium]|nr:hypothetical protein [Gemmatimonadales bacterium]
MNRNSCRGGRPDQKAGVEDSMRLAELYESRGNLVKAGEQYARFIELWEHADPELQPAVREARERLAAIKGKTG